MDEEILIVVAHPDDETLGCSHLLLRHPQQCRVLHTTDGAPREARFWQQAGVNSREEYAEARRRELHAAATALGFPLTRLHHLPFADRDLVHHLTPLAEALDQFLETYRPALLYTHPFEGGHPDHDATCLAVHAICAQRRLSQLPAPEIREFTGYHARNGEFHSGAFLNDASADGAEVLSPEELRRKQAALDCFESQQRVIRRFSLSPEQWRRSPTYCFAQRPHSGPLYHEIREMGVPFETFEIAARTAFPQLFRNISRNS